MSKKQETTAKPKQKNGTYVIRFGKKSGDDTIFASVFLKTANAGFKYLSYSLSRRYTVGDVQRYSSDFYHYNAGAIADVSIQAAAFIKDHKDNPAGAIEGAGRLNAKRFGNTKQTSDAPAEIIDATNAPTTEIAEAA